MLIFPAPAKINLALEVLRRRADSWHDIESIVLPIDWHDLVGLDVTHHAVARVTGPASAGVPGAAGALPAAENLAVRAAAALDAMAIGPRGGGRSGRQRLNVWVHKRVPVGAGLGGGSADAAAVLRGGVRALRDCGFAVDTSRIGAIAAELGSDVPALFAGTPVHVTGRGEHLTEIAAPPLHLVIAFLGPSSTENAYRALRPEDMSDGSRVQRLVATLLETVREGVEQLASELAEDLFGSALEAAALRVNEQLRSSARRLRASTPTLRWHMTGSGGAFFAVTSDAAASDAVARRLRGDGVAARACHTLPSSPLRL